MNYNMLNPFLNKTTDYMDGFIGDAEYIGRIFFHIYKIKTKGEYI